MIYGVFPVFEGLYLIIVFPSANFQKNFEVVRFEVSQFGPNEYMFCPLESLISVYFIDISSTFLLRGKLLLIQWLSFFQLFDVLVHHANSQFVWYGTNCSFVEEISRHIIYLEKK